MTDTPKLVLGHIVCIGPDDEEGIPYDEAVIHFEGDEDSEIAVHCPGALRLAPKIVAAVNNYDSLVAALKDIRKKVHAHNRGGELTAGLRDVVRGICDQALGAVGGAHD